VREKVKFTRRQRLWALAKFILFLLILLIACWTSGFVVFANHVSKTTEPVSVPQADGIVVLTGKGGGRLASGGRLLAKGKAERLFISGVNPETPHEDIMELIGVSEDLAECCIDLDAAAKDTIGNARETAAWTQALAYEHIILVTSAYHMPRARSEINAAAGRIRISAYPVVSDTDPEWWNERARIKRLVTEYTKLLITYIREPNEKDKLAAPILGEVPGKAG